MKNVLLVLLGLAGVGALTYYCANHHRSHIEADLSGRTSEALVAGNLPKITTEAEGQIITLRGVVPDEATKTKAGVTAAGIWGVSEVRNLLEVAAPVVEAPKVVMSKEERVAAVNCQAEFNSLLTEPVRFKTGRGDLDPRSFPLLDKLAKAAQACPSASVEIGGHTDPRGSLDMNMKLSQSRANSVLSYLTKKGIDKNRLTAIGFGPEKPIADNATADGMEKNRRTEFKVKGI